MTTTPTSPPAAPAPPVVTWTEFDAPVTARWRSEAGQPPPKRVRVADEKLALDEAYKLVCEGTALLWRGDYHRGKDLLQALAKRIDGRGRGESGTRRGDRRDAPARGDARPGARHGASAAANAPAHATTGAPASAPAGATARTPAPTPAELAAAFHRQRQAQGARTRVLGMLLVPFEPQHVLALRRAPDVRAACTEAFGVSDERVVMPLRDLLGAIGAHEWRKAGVEVPALGARIHAHYGVFSPVRGEYLDLVAKAPLPDALKAGADVTRPEAFAIDVGTGTGVVAAVLGKRGVRRIVATDTSPRALSCARDNLARLGLAERVGVEEADLFPAAEPGRASLVVCNPPWLPGRAVSTLEQAVYDPESRMLRGFLAGLAARLADGGEGWLILSDLAERLGLRSRTELETWIAEGGLVVRGRLDTRPRHGRAFDASDPLHAARSAEVTSLWRLARADEAA